MRYVAVAVFALAVGCQDLLGFRPFVVGTRDATADASGEKGDEPSGDASRAGNAAIGGAGMAANNASGGAPGGKDGGSGGATSDERGGGTVGTAGTRGTGGCVARCDGKEDAVTAIACDGRGRLDCMKTDTTHECNPAGGTCITVDIDEHEVTFRDYYDWLSKKPSVAVAGCSWKNDAFAPDQNCLSDVRLPCSLDGEAACDAASSCAASSPDCSDSSFPIVCVDWCDAAAYCAARGRSLCGRLRGGGTPFDSFDDPGESKWMNACSAAGQFTYASGDVPPPFCSYDGLSMYEAGSREGCSSPSPGYSSFKDLSGNAAEWEDSCRQLSDAAPGQYDECHVRGGSYTGALERVRCDANEARQRSETRFDLGFRCCGS